MIIDLVGPDGIVRRDVGDLNRLDVYRRIFSWEDRLWLEPMYRRKEGVQAVSVVCDLCGNREVAQARLIWYERRGRRVLVYGFRAEENDSVEIVRRRVALGEKPDQEWIDHVPDLYGLVGSDPGPRVAAPLNEYVEVVKDDSTVANAWCPAHQWFDISFREVEAAARTFEERGAKRPAILRLRAENCWNTTR